MKKAVLIIEDDTEQMNMLKELVRAVSANTVVYAVDNVTDAYRVLMEKTIDVFLVDIILDAKKPGDTAGARLVERARKIPKYMFTPVIFTTSMEDPNMHAYTDLNCIGYLEKPFDNATVMRLIERALNYTTEREKDVSLSFRKDGILYLVNLKEIVYLESVNHIMYVHLSDGTVLDIPYKTCKQIQQEEDVDCLVQCCRGTLVNREYVLGVDVTNRFLMLKGNFGMVNIGGRYKKKVLAEFS